MNRFAGFLIIVMVLLAIPLGQLLRIDNFLGIAGINLVGIDVAAGTSLFFVIKHRKDFLNTFGILIGYLLFTTLLSFVNFPKEVVFSGMGYLVRLISYFSLFVVISKYVKSQKESTQIQQLMMASVVLLCIFGWLQYFYYPDLRDLKYLGWDDHLYRMVSTILDPNYMGSVVLIGASISNFFFIKSQNRKLVYAILSIFFFITILFTYSRATYLSLLAMIIVTLLKKIKYRKFFLLLMISFFFIFFLPRYESEGVKLERLHSVFTRIENYKESVLIIAKYPLLGVGYNNLCEVRNEFGSMSRSCGGSDSSILYILATSGVIGLLLFADLGSKIYRNLQSEDKLLIEPFFVSLLVHSFFNNTLFYPYIAVPFVMILAASQKNQG